MIAAQRKADHDSPLISRAYVAGTAALTNKSPAFLLGFMATTLSRALATLAIALLVMSLGLMSSSALAGFDTETANVEQLETAAHAYMAQDPPNWRAAHAAFGRAAELGSVRAKSYLGWLYEQGHGVDTNHVTAARWYAEVADAGVHDYAVKLGWMYMGSSSLTPDREKAEYWFGQAIAGDHLAANIALASVLIADALGGKSVERVFEARSLLEVALDGGERLAAFFLARLYVEGVGGHPIEDDLGARYTRMSAEDGHSQMQGWLAQMHLQGRGVPTDRLEAAFWAALAAAGDDPLGRRLHATLSETLSAEEQKTVLERTFRWALEHQPSHREQ